MSISIVEFNKESWFSITNLDALRPFFMNVVSDSNHWMFISSNGGVTAGRKNAQYALFPYYTDDKLTELAHTTGSKTIFRVSTEGTTHVWEPFTERFADQYTISRNLYKNRYGNKIMFEEINHNLGLVFRYQWNSSHDFGFVRKVALINTSSKSYDIAVLDGIQNIMPYGVSSDLQSSASNLVDAYKRSELVQDSGLGIYALSAIIVDKAEPSEALKANVAYAIGLENSTRLLSSLQLEAFRKQKALTPELDVKGEKGAYFVVGSIQLAPKADANWRIVANVNLNHAQIIELNEALKRPLELTKLIDADIARGTTALIQLVASSDGLQQSADALLDARHYSNVLFNIMRGGIFDANYRIEKQDFLPYIKRANKDVFQHHRAFLSALPDVFDVYTLHHLLNSIDDADLLRLAKEYLPLKFSRRHGDPSRPWNKFSINMQDEVDGSKILDYEGNWRDIFQNWEALAHSFPGFVEGMMFKFLNASTFDGYNPYRVTKGGFDWETIEPDNPWSYIGYWGDHQIIYLLKFLEFYARHNPAGLDALFSAQQFVYAHVPYRIATYDNIAADPKNTITFDEKADHAIRKRVAKLGADGALLRHQKDGIHQVSFMEKILATVLSKVSNFIPEAGIWMNTQRPEWNDANNALVGNGVSMVTLYYLRRFMHFLQERLATSQHQDIQISEELKACFEDITRILNSNTALLKGSFSNADRKRVTEGLGRAGSAYRERIYNNGFSGRKTTLHLDDIKHFASVSLAYIDHSIQANRRSDNLYHAYNLMSFTKDGIAISYLNEMLEGQVAAISSGYLNADEVLKVLDALRKSALYRADQQSYMLYPNKELPGFLTKNSIPAKAIEQSALLSAMVKQQHQGIVSKDVLGGYHFNGNFKNAGDVTEALEALSSTEYAPLVEQDKAYVLQVFEDVFNHKAFTGRSGTFYAYEGLGSIYWHMVSKLYLAVMEAAVAAHEQGASPEVCEHLARHFDAIGAGIGVHKSPELYGAFPTDPYSHTPFHRGAQQPGMTGQVKEDILARIGELGVWVVDGVVHFSPVLLKKSALQAQTSRFAWIDVHQQHHTLALPEQALCFTFTQVPVVYALSKEDGISVTLSNGETRQFSTLALDAQTSEALFKRTGSISAIHVHLNERHFR